MVYRYWIGFDRPVKYPSFLSLETFPPETAPRPCRRPMLFHRPFRYTVNTHVCPITWVATRRSELPVPLPKGGNFAPDLANAGLLHLVMDSIGRA